MIVGRIALSVVLALLGTAASLFRSGEPLRPPMASSSEEDGQWTMPGKNFASTRFSGLTQITSANATRLRPVWSFSTGVLGGHEGQPLVVNNTMYVVTPYPNVVYAFDLTKEGYPLRWKYRPNVNPAAIGISCCDVVNRGAFYADGKIYFNLLDGHTVALDAASGKEIWKTKVADVNAGETTPMAPLVVKDRVIVGTAGGEYGVRGWVKGLNCQDRRHRMDGLQHRPRRRGAGPARHVQAVLPEGKAARPRQLADGWLEEGRRTRVGLAVIRSRARSGLLRHRKPRALEHRATPGRQSLGNQRHGA